MSDASVWPRRVVSWWSSLEDLLWPEQRVRDMIQRRADALAEARVDTAIQFGFHYRFDCAYFGLLHGLLAEVAEALHARGIRFLDHYSCNCIARPRTREDLVAYHSSNRHCIAIHPDALAAETMEYAGFRFNDLRELDVETGAPAYVPRYQCELFCHNNPNYLAMHEAYLRRQVAEIPLDGLMSDDMCDYALFRGCGCRHCRERFAREYGHDLPPFADKSFWGDTNAAAYHWGNYENPAFRDWVAMRYRAGADHLAMVRRVIGDRILMTCCSNNGPTLLNSLGLSYESFLAQCDWVMLENCGVTADAVNWARTEPEAMLSKAIARMKAPPDGAPAVALSYSIYDDGAYLAWAVARFWGTANWFSTLSAALPITPPDAKSDADLIGRLNRWEQQCSDLDPRDGRDVVEVRLAFTRATRDNGWRADGGLDHWERVQRWSQALLANDIGYRFITGDELADADAVGADASPLILDACAHLSDAQCESIRRFVGNGGSVWVVPPLGTHDQAARPRPQNFLAQLGGNVRTFDVARGPAVLPEIIAAGGFSPKVRCIGGPSGWRVRLRRHGEKWVVHLLNAQLQGLAHPNVRDRWLRSNVLHRIEAPAAHEPLVLDIDLRDFPASDFGPIVLQSPELSDPLPVHVERLQDRQARLYVSLSSLAIYGVLASDSLWRGIKVH